MISVKLHTKSFWHVLVLQGILSFSYWVCKYFLFSCKSRKCCCDCRSICVLSLVLTWHHPCLHSLCLNRGLIVPSKEKKKDKRSKLMRKLGRSRNENPLSQSQRAPGLVGLLETMRVQMEVFSSHLLFKWRHYYSISSPFSSPFMACLLTWNGVRIIPIPDFPWVY